MILGYINKTWPQQKLTQANFAHTASWNKFPTKHLAFDLKPQEKPHNKPWVFFGFICTSVPVCCINFFFFFLYCIVLRLCIIGDKLGEVNHYIATVVIMQVVLVLCEHGFQSVHDCKKYFCLGKVKMYMAVNIKRDFLRFWKAYTLEIHGFHQYSNQHCGKGSRETDCGVCPFLGHYILWWMAVPYLTLTSNEGSCATIHTEKYIIYREMKSKRAPTGPQVCEDWKDRRRKTQIFINHCGFLTKPL